MKEVRVIVDQTKCMECGKDVDENNSLVCNGGSVKRGKLYIKNGFICFDCAGWNGLPPAGQGHIGPGTEEYERRTGGW